MKIKTDKENLLFIITLVAMYTVIIAFLYMYAVKSREAKIKKEESILLDHLIDMNSNVLQMREESKREILSLEKSLDSAVKTQEKIIQLQPIYYETYYDNTVHITSASDSEHYSYLPRLAHIWDSLDRAGVWWDKPKAYRTIPSNNQ